MGKERGAGRGDRGMRVGRYSGLVFRGWQGWKGQGRGGDGVEGGQVFRFHGGGVGVGMIQ